MIFQEKVVFITGGGSEMSTATTKELLKEGAKVFLTDIDKNSLENVVNENNKFNENIYIYVADITSYDEILKATNKAIEVFGKIDILINCAGIIKHCPIDEMTVDDWNSVINVDLTGMFNACKAVVPELKKNNYGRIVNISSISGRTGRAVGVNYAAAKAGVVGLTETLAKELGKWNITSNAIAPGPLKGKMFLTMKPELIEELEKGSPLGRIGEMKDIAYAIKYLASDEASWVTGEVLDVNGGMYI